MPGTDIADVRVLYLEPVSDALNAAELRTLIESNLRQRGIRIEDQQSTVVLADGDFVFNVAADWHWDIAWYLLDLRVAIYDPKDNTLVAQAQSQQTSLVRRSNEIVVARAMASLFDDPNELDGEK